MNVHSKLLVQYTENSLIKLKLIKYAFVIAAVLWDYHQAIAQTPDPSSLPKDRLEDIPTRTLPSEVLQKPSDQEQLPTPTDLPEQQDPVQNDTNAKFRVDRIEVVGSKVFPPEKFASITDPFVGREVSFAELLQVRDAITKLYTDNGYVTTGALITPQTVEAGVITIQIVEGSLQEIKIVGNRRLRSQYIRDRIQLGASKPLNVPRLIEKLQILRLDPRIQNLSAELQMGVAPGTNILQVEVQEADTFSLTATLDNGRSPSVGSFRRGVNLQEANLLGLGDTLSVGYSNTDGSNSINLNYQLPINTHNGTVSFGLNQGWNRVIEDPFSVLDIQSNTTSYEFGYRQPLIQKPTQELAVGLSFSRQESQTELGLDNIGGFPLSPGADAEGRTKISALRFTQEYTQRSNEQVFAARSQFSLGVNWFDANVNEDEPDSRFFAWRGQAQWVKQLAPDTLFLARGDIQLASTSLVPLEQFGLGGQLSVRGYRQDTLLTDNGLLLSGELRLPIFRAAKLGGVLQLTPFMDVGTGWNTQGNNPSPSTFVGTGLGLLWKQGDSFSARLDWGIPLTSVDGEKRSLQENGLYFSIHYTPF
ncbi:Surface antigen variable number [Trichormus variabilis ATCC 29413]|uniref:Surface antigen variable number n=2 Tax=Anabaena variabilis TaxID=264691 RepID=Q3MAM0_TRIV2|nr:MULTISPECIES: ShlB/FhaC/HecB family hemolysin secretion/activation protein [Nostocaceae]ABA21966.1 Surface antigen variable number [Trichormus variabilis ATCC 29413]MBC1215607.1 ShlB/FhaC/HecB family hemolysin secretion/activation protein [Trichormus variabilis ARAD]MBC1254546.1 ShlB/FhaC/HecB family hemolysin secretion/activation protein [Trichormus variabilis V5]MBC1267843.1 ShlB/FhaC/HecB family hemolysin secretion/activation protein [Trichormus variabilis FSR]MBC1304196.1 ShlB/FhaC/HecB